jgi:ABC-type multidrug transport system fused ATPase/permease subunit
MEYSFSFFIRDVAHYVKPYRVKFFLACFFRLTSDLSNLYPAFALSRIIYFVTLARTPVTYFTILQTIALWTVALIYRGISKEFAKYYGFQVAERSALDLYRDCLRHIFSLDLAWQEIENSGNKFKRITHGRDGMNQIIRRLFAVFIEVAVNTIGIVFIFFQQNISIAFSLIFFMITFYVMGIFLLKKASYHEQRSSKKDEDLGGITFEALNNIRTIKALSIDTNISSLISKKITSLVEEIRLRIFWYRMQSGILNLYFYIFQIIVVVYILNGIWQGNYTISILILFVGLFQRVGESIWELMEVTQDVVMSKIWVGRAREILNTTSEIEHPERINSQSNFPKNWKEIRIEKIKFMYHTQDVLQNITTTIKRGEKIGIVGISGSGKTTLFKLLMDLYETYEGDIFFDSIPLRHIKRQSYIDHVSVVLQDTELFNMSLRENITITAVPGQKQHTELLTSVIRTAHLEDVIAQLPDGLDTLVGEKGIKLSGGQRQRVGIARALYRQPEILLLDEATSHLDVHSEKQIQQALHEAFDTCTAVVIAHRLSTIKEMDRIIVMQEGEIREQGTFDALIRKKGIFSTMWDEQTL